MHGNPEPSCCPQSRSQIPHRMHYMAGSLYVCCEMAYTLSTAQLTKKLRIVTIIQDVRIAGHAAVVLGIIACNLHVSSGTMVHCRVGVMTVSSIGVCQACASPALGPTACMLQR